MCFNENVKLKVMGIEFYTSNSKLELFIIQDKESGTYSVPMIAITPSLEGKSGRPKAGEQRFNYDQRLIIRLELQELAMLVDILDAHIKAPQLLATILANYKFNQRQNENTGVTIYEYSSIRPVNENINKTFSITVEPGKSVFVSIKQDKTRVAFPLHTQAGAFKYTCMTILQHVILEEVIQKPYQNQKKQKEQKLEINNDQLNTQQAEQSQETMIII